MCHLSLIRHYPSCVHHTREEEEDTEPRDPFQEASPDDEEDQEEVENEQEDICHALSSIREYVVWTITWILLLLCLPWFLCLHLLCTFSHQWMWIDILSDRAHY